MRAAASLVGETSKGRKEPRTSCTLNRHWREMGNWNAPYTEGRKQSRVPRGCFINIGRLYHKISDKNFLASARMPKMDRGWVFQHDNDPNRKS